jgi:hypothetical protein
MSHQPALRALTIAALIAATLTGCARTPMSNQAAVPTKRTGAAAIKAAPVSADALAVARKWESGAQQVGVSIIASRDSVIKAETTDDVATYVFAAPGKTDAMLVVIATDSGFKAQEMPLAATAAAGIAKMAPLSGLAVKLLDSKDIFRAAEAAGLSASRDMVVLNTLDHGKGVPMALVTSQDGLHYVIVDAVSGKARSAVSQLSAERRVQLHELAAITVIVGAVGTVAIWGAKKLITKFWKGKSKPSPTPTPAPSSKPADEPAAEPSPVLSAPPGDEF